MMRHDPTPVNMWVLKPAARPCRSRSYPMHPASTAVSSNRWTITHSVIRLSAVCWLLCASVKLRVRVDVEGQWGTLASSKQRIGHTGNHRPVIHAERGGRKHHVEFRGLALLLEPLAQPSVGRHPATDHDAPQTRALAGS